MIPVAVRVGFVGLPLLSLGILSAPAPTESRQSAAAIDACVLITKADVEAATKRLVTAGAKSQVANLATCAFADPKTPIVKILSLNVLIGASAADAKGAYSIAKSNAASVEAVAGVGEQAYWDKYVHTLRATKGKYQVDLSLDGDVGGLDAAKALLIKALARLP